MLAKTIPMIILAAGGVKNKDKIERLLLAPKVAVTQMEVGTISRMFVIESLDRERIEPEKFSEFVRSAVRSQVEGVRKDVALDLWDQPYRLKYEGNQAIIYSSGPDRIENTDDDIRSRVTL